MTDPRIARLVDDLDRRHPVDQREADSIERFRSELAVLLAAGVDPFERDHGPVHVTASAVVTGERGVLLLRHRRLGIWLQPGGHVDAGETPWDAAAREAREETGLDVAPATLGPDGTPEMIHVDVHDGGRGHLHLDVRYRFLAEGDPDPGPEESQEIDWFAWDEAIARADPGLSGLLRFLSVTPRSRSR